MAGVPAGIPLARRGRWSLALAAVPFAGCVALALPPTLAPLTGIPWGAWELQVLVAAILLGGLVELMLRGDASPGARHESSRLELVLAIAVVAGGALWIVHDGWTFSGTRPHYGWDGLSIWLLRGKVLGQAGDFPAALFREPDLAGSHWDYPLVLPAFAGWGWRRGDQAPQLSFSLGVLAAALLLSTFAPLTRHMRATLAAAIALMPFAVPAALDLHFKSYADPLLVSATTAGFAWAVTGLLTRDRALLVTASLPLIVVAGTKNEGAVLVMGIALATATAAAVERRLPQEVRTLAWTFVPAGVFFLVWRSAVAILGVGSDLASGASVTLFFDRLGVVLYALGSHLSRSLAHVGAALAVVVVLALSSRQVRAGRARLVAALLVAPALYLAALILVYGTTPYDLRWHLLNSLERTTMVFAPLLLVIAASVGTRRLGR